MPNWRLARCRASRAGGGREARCRQCRLSTAKMIIPETIAPCAAPLPFIAINGKNAYNNFMGNPGKELWSVFRTLGNVVRVKLVRMAFDCGAAGVNVSSAAKALGIGEPAVSTYLRQLADCGILHRSRIGLQVNYFEDMDADASRKIIIEALRYHRRSGGQPEEAAALFKALGNATRVSALTVVAYKPCDIDGISDRISVPNRTILRQMSSLLDAEIVALSEKGVFSILPPNTPLRKRIFPLISRLLLQ